MEPKAIKGGEVEMGHKELWDSLEEAENMWNFGTTRNEGRKRS